MIGDDTVLMRNYSGCDEVNDGGKSYRVNRWGVVRVPAIGSSAADEDRRFSYREPGRSERAAQHDRRRLRGRMVAPPSKERSTLLAILESPNSMSHLTQSILFK